MWRWLSNVFRLGLKEIREPCQRQGAGCSSSSTRSPSAIYSDRDRGEDRGRQCADRDRRFRSLRAVGAHPRRLPAAPISVAPISSIVPTIDRRDGSRRLHVRARYSAAVRSRCAARARPGAAAQHRRDRHDAGRRRARAMSNRSCSRRRGSYLQARGIEAQLPVAAVTRAFFNPNLEGVWFQAVMAVLENVTMLSMLLVGAAVIRERERGTIEHLLVMPIRPSEIAAAKIWANGLVILVAAGIVAAARRPAGARGADRRLDRAVPRRDGGLSVRDRRRSASCSRPSPTRCRNSRCSRSRSF